MTEATSSGFYKRQRALRQCLAVPKAELLRLAGPMSGERLAWFKPGGEMVPRAPLSWQRPRPDLTGRS
jgi:hypothetical protein